MRWILRLSGSSIEAHWFFIEIVPPFWTTILVESRFSAPKVGTKYTSDKYISILSSVMIVQDPQWETLQVPLTVWREIFDGNGFDSKWKLPVQWKLAPESNIQDVMEDGFELLEARNETGALDFDLNLLFGCLHELSKCFPPQWRHGRLNDVLSSVWFSCEVRRIR